MNKFNWEDVLHDSLIKKIMTAAGINVFTDISEIRDILLRLLKIVGGLPFTDRNPSDTDWDEFAISLIENALREAFVDELQPSEEKGTHLRKNVQGHFYNEIEHGKLVHVNWCKEADLEQLPEIGDKHAKQIIHERRSNGAFTGGKNLADRIPGIGEKTITKLLWRLRFRQSPTAVASPEDFYELIEWLTSKTKQSPEDALMAVFEYTLTRLIACNRKRYDKARILENKLIYAEHDCPWIGILEGSEYYYWLADAISAADSKIDMAMFHIALPSTNHPTRLLIEKLKEAKRRGVKIRVLLDRDRDKDPYRSSVINKAAFDQLSQADIEVRFDAADQLLHSKFLIIDAEMTVLGSHNWSAGSYFHYDDLSLVISSSSLAEKIGSSFEDLWTASA